MAAVFVLQTVYLHFRTWATDPAHSRKIGGTEVRLEFDLAVCRPCPKDGRCVGLTEEGLTEAWEGRSRDVASVTDRSLEDRGVRGEVTKQVLKLGGGSATVWGVILSHPQPNPKEFDMGYIKMQAIGPGQCVVKAELSAFIEVGARDSIFYRVEDPGRRPKIPVAANKLVNFPATPRFEVLGVIDGREILNKSKNCTRKWWPKWKKTKKATAKKFAATKRMLSPHDDRIVKPAKRQAVEDKREAQRAE